MPVLRLLSRKGLASQNPLNVLHKIKIGVWVGARRLIAHPDASRACIDQVREKGGVAQKSGMSREILHKRFDQFLPIVRDPHHLIGDIPLLVSVAEVFPARDSVINAAHQALKAFKRLLNLGLDGYTTKKPTHDALLLNANLMFLLTEANRNIC